MAAQNRKECPKAGGRQHFSHGVSQNSCQCRDTVFADGLFRAAKSRQRVETISSVIAPTETSAIRSSWRRAPQRPARSSPSPSNRTPGPVRVPTQSPAFGSSGSAPLSGPASEPARTQSGASAAGRFTAARAACATSAPRARTADSPGIPGGSRARAAAGAPASRAGGRAPAGRPSVCRDCRSEIARVFPGGGSWKSPKCPAVPDQCQSGASP
jgi:hypothetical protein